MATHIVFVAAFDDDLIELSFELPKARPGTGVADSPFPVMQSYVLTRLWIEAETPPILQADNLTREQYREWLSILGEFREEVVEPKLVTLGLGGLCVDIKVAAVDAVPHGALLEAIVENVGSYPIGKVHVVWHGKWNPMKDSRLIGQGFHFVEVGELSRALLSGESRRFALMKPTLLKALSYAAVLDPDEHYLTVEASLPGHGATYEICRRAGADLHEAVVTLERFLEAEKKR